ncbi:hypothetical protein M378DRAFT_553805 [Amanita muscaria Koide BX008]|uniref:mRNA export factor GLE1 n=1 Tax=Amanita muscaria (strain Koide BX008) TaxID=946122 RepID=A0A0C2WTC4_AMAMK|nr:hypothetical protein M378DRAFT_553805 [Amanita muscaria Koide BX008]
MRFSAPRSPSTSPERGQFRGRSSYGLFTDSESAPSDHEVESDLESVESSTSSDSRLQLSDLRIRRNVQKPSVSRSRTDAEMRYIEDTIAAIRLRTRHQDPYEKWEQETRKDAFRTAKKTLTESQTRWHDEREKARAADLERLAALHAQQRAEVQGYLQQLRQQQQNEEKRLREDWKARDQQLWKRIESGISLEQDKARKKLEEEQRIRQEAEMRRRLEEEKRRMEEEKRKKEEEEAQRQREEKARREAEEKQKQEEEEKARLERQKQAIQRNEIGLSTANEDWRNYRAMLHRLKTETMKVVKENKQLKKEWGELRRQITPKIGQLTNDDQSIRRITMQVIQVFKPSDAPRPPVIYHALLSSLAKAIISQAETEVTAEVRTAEPLSKVTVNLLENLDGFPPVFFARLVQRVGSWAIPVILPGTDHDGRPWKDNAEAMKVMGYRKGATGEETETTAEYCSRIAGIMRVYFHILKFRPMKGPLWAMFQTPRYWVWFSRMVGGQHRALLESPAAAYLIHTALDVMGSYAMDIWGLQWIKILSLVYQGATEGVTTAHGERLLIGGASAEGKSARVRVQLEIERIMANVHPATIAAQQPTLFS